MTLAGPLPECIASAKPLLSWGIGCLRNVVATSLKVRVMIVEIPAGIAGGDFSLAAAFRLNLALQPAHFTGFQVVNGRHHTGALLFDRFANDCRALHQLLGDGERIGLHHLAHRLAAGS